MVRKPGSGNSSAGLNPEHMYLAVIDMGTNTFNLLISELNDKGALIHLFSDKISVKLGKDTIHRNYLSADAIRRALDALSIFFEKIRNYQPIKTAVYATEAIRAAVNRDQLLHPAQEKFGIDIQVINGDYEAELICMGVRQAVEFSDQPAIIMDIGGGSNELIIADCSSIFWKHSYPLGVARLAEQIKPSEPITHAQILELEHILENGLTDFFEAVARYKPTVMVGSSGAFDSFADMIYHVDPVFTHPYTVKSNILGYDQFINLYGLLIGSTYAERLKMKGLIEMRADLIVLAAIIVRYLLERCKIVSLIQSEYALKEGAAEALAEQILSGKKI